MSENPVESRSSDTSPGDVVVNWDRIIHKNVRTLDNQGFGKVIAVPNDEDTIIISSQSGSEQYKIPRSVVSGFNGAEVLLNETAYKIMSPFSSYRVDKAGVYEAKPSDIITKEEPSEQDNQEETTIPLIEERLNVNKRTLTTQYTITKEPVTQRKTIEIPVTHEELVVEKRPPPPPKDSSSSSSSTSVQGPVKSKTEIRVPLMREEAEVTKEPFVKEEVVVKKKPVTETRTVSDTVTKEGIKMSGTDSTSQQQGSTTNTQE
ncbi:MAG: YsnF/AvaK domain-containing protein [Thermoproteota archaeon]|nr:YsnF/AvaK domain-containing protein [Thermoproteota archaeon]